MQRQAGEGILAASPNDVPGPLRKLSQKLVEVLRPWRSTSAPKSRPAMAIPHPLGYESVHLGREKRRDEDPPGQES